MCLCHPLQELDLCDQAARLYPSCSPHCSTAACLFGLELGSVYIIRAWWEAVIDNHGWAPQVEVCTSISSAAAADAAKLLGLGCVCVYVCAWVYGSRVYGCV